MLKEDRKKLLSGFTNLLKLAINDLQLLSTAFTHGSYVKESNIKSLQDNERLEFFGDAVLKMFISEYLMSKYPNYSEGQLSKICAYVVSEKVLTKISNKLNLRGYLLLGRNERRATPVSILADALEALLAVIYYECGAHKAKEFILNYWEEHIESVDESIDKDNYKAVLQEFLQGNRLDLPTYKTLSEVGPDHNKKFEVGVFLNNNKLAKGLGKTKKDASQEAAKNALMILRKLNEGKLNKEKVLKNTSYAKK